MQENGEKNKIQVKPILIGPNVGAFVPVVISGNEDVAQKTVYFQYILVLIDTNHFIYPPPVMHFPLFGQDWMFVKKNIHISKFSQIFQQVSAGHMTSHMSCCRSSFPADVQSVAFRFPSNAETLPCFSRWMSWST